MGAEACREHRGHEARMHSLETEPSLLGVRAHLVAVAEKEEVPVAIGHGAGSRA